VTERDATEEPIEVVEVDETVEVIDVEEPPVRRKRFSVRPASDADPDAAGNPDSWLQWALIIGLLALFLICALLILIGWNGR
jgi:hypothetical protein